MARWCLLAPTCPTHSLIGLDLLHCSHPNPLSGLLLQTAGSRVLVMGELNHLPLPDVDQVGSVSQEGKKGYWAGRSVSSARAPYKTYQKTQQRAWNLHTPLMGQKAVQPLWKMVWWVRRTFDMEYHGTQQFHS